jgi:uncharacterized protein (DUF58 family)
MVRPTPRGYAFLGLAAATYIAGRLIGTWELYLLAFAFLASVLTSLTAVLLTGRRIKATRSISLARPVAGDEPDIVFQITNSSILPGPELELRSPLGGMSTLDLRLVVDSIGPHAQKTLRGRTGRVNRGVHVLPASTSLAEDPLGLAKSSHRLTDAMVTTVLPRIALLDSCALYPDVGLKHDWSGKRGLLPFGASEFRGVRPHQPGEPLSHIDWKSTAKTGSLMIREMDEPAGADVTLLLDGSSAQLAGRLPSTNFEMAVSAAGSIADFVLRSSRGVTLLCHERTWRKLNLTPDGSGRRALMQALAEAQPNASAPLVNALRHLRTDGPQLLHAQSVTVVSISLDRALVRSLVQLRDDGARLAFLYVTGASFSDDLDDHMSTLLPFLPPRGDKTIVVRHRAAPDEDQHSPSVAESLPPETRALLLSLSSAGIPCLTLGRGDNLTRRLSLVQPRATAGTRAMGS